MKKILFIFLLFLFLGKVVSVQAQAPDVNNEQKYEAEVIQILEDKNVEIFPGTIQPYQKVKAKITDGDMKGESVVAELGKITVSTESQKLKAGDKIIISRIKKVDGTSVYYVEDFLRRSSLYILLIVFIISVVIVGGIRGLTSFIGLIISFVILLKFIIPKIIEGENPVIVSIIGSVMIIFSTLYLAHGVSRRTTAAVLGTSISLAITGILAWFFIDFSRLTGFVSEQAAFLNLFPGVKINLTGILLGGVIIGALGVLDDVTISQSASVFELQNANKSLSWKELYLRGLRIGKEHIASLVNTLVLAYAGASLPLLLLFTLNGGEPFNILINREMIASEVVRMLVGSLGLVSAVPITTAIAASFCKFRSHFI